MIMFVRQYLLCAGFFVLSVAPSLAGEQLDEVNTKFTYAGKPIHPYLIREFSNWISDNRPPMITSVDVVAAFDTNKYQESVVVRRSDWWFAETKENDGDIALYESFGYRWLGKMANGVHVLEVGGSGGGSGFFEDLMFVKFSEGEIRWEGKRTKQLLMTIVGVYTLGDRYDGVIKVYPNRVGIGASKDQQGGGLEEDLELWVP